MTASTSVPYDWLRHIPHSLLEQDEIPILSSPGPFPWERMTAFLAKTFQLERLEISAGQWESHTLETMLKGLGSPLKILNIELSPVQGLVSWAMAESDINTLMSLILTKEARASDLIEKEYREGFFEFVAMEALLAFNRSEYDKGLAPHIIDSAAPPEGPSLCMDVTINCGGISFIGRLILSEEFRHSWKERYVQHKMTIDMAPDLAQKIQVVVNLEAGRTALMPQEWRSIHAGDYLILDSCSLDPGNDKGRVLITLDGQPLFRGMVKQGNIKILEFPLYQEVDTTMTNHDEDDEETDEYFDESEIEEETGEFHDDEEEEEFEEDEDSEEHSVVEKASSPAPKAAQPKTQAPTPSQASPSPKVSPEEIPMTVIVEVGRLQMSIQKLVELQPGNLLELDVHPENGVDLVVNGKCIGRGELLRIGDTLGVRILDKG